MMRRDEIFAAILLGCLASAPRADASEERLWAIVIAVEEYSNPDLLAPPHVREHLDQLKAIMEDPKRFPTIGPRLRVLSGKADENNSDSPTAEHVRTTFAEVARDALPEDRLLVVILATGADADDEHRWLMADADPARRSATTILSSELSELIEATQCRQTLSLVDTTFNLVQWSQKPDEDNDRSHPYSELAMAGRVVLASNDGFPPSKDVWAKESAAFFKALLAGLAGEADDDGGEPDGWIDTKELVEFVRRTDANAVVEGTAGNVWLATVPGPQSLFESRRSELEKKKDAGEIDERTYSHGVKLLARMPRFNDDRELRQTYIDYLNGKKTADELASLRRRVLTQRNSDEKEAGRFATTVGEVHDLIAQSHIRSDQAPSSLAIGLRELADRYGEQNEPWVEDSINQLMKQSGPELVRELFRFRMRLGKRNAIETPATDICLSAMLRSLDPYSAYLPPEIFRELKDQAQGHFTGIGVVVKENPKASSLVVLLLLPNGPAERAGIKPGDRIIAVDGVDVSKSGVPQASRKLIGPEGTDVTLTVEPKNGPSREIVVKREEVLLDSVFGYRRRPDGTWDYWIDKPHGTGYVRIANFAEDTADRLRKIIGELEREGLRNLIIDLRFNPGGLLTSAVDVADLFLKEGTIVRIRDRKGNERVESAHGFGTINGVGLILLVNGGSASGSEIVSAALQDAGRAKIAGSRTFGKGSAQDVIPLSDGQSAVKLTTEVFVRPSGKNLERHLGGRLENAEIWGVTPDQDFQTNLFREDNARLRAELLRRQFSDSEMDAGPPQEDTQLEKVVQALAEPTVLGRPRAG